MKCPNCGKELKTPIKEWDLNSKVHVKLYECCGKKIREIFKNKVAYSTINVNSEEAKVMSSISNVIFVGMKPPMSYVLAIMKSFSGTEAEVTLKARGQAINNAVDAAEIARHRFMKELSVSKISIGTEEMPSREGENRNRNISTIEITLTRQ